MMDVLLAAELDVQLATGWHCDYLDDLPAERVLTLHLRWQYNQMRFSGMSFGVGGGVSDRASQREDHWKSQTLEETPGRIKKRINVEDLWNPRVAQMINGL